MPQALAARPVDPSTPPTPEDDLEVLGEQIANLFAHITAATYQLLALLQEFDRREGWACGFNSCAHWLSWRTGLALGPAREKVRVARALADLPRLSEAMSRGELSYSKIRALTRVATPENEQDLLDFARAGTASHVERLVRAWRRVDRSEEAEHEALRHASRYLSLWTDEDGMVVVRGRLEPEAGAALIKAVEAATDLLYDEDKERETPTREGTPRGQRRADALGRVAEAALAGGLDRGTRGDRYQVVLHVDAPVLAEPKDVPAGTPQEPAPPQRRKNGATALPFRGNVPAGTSRERTGAQPQSAFEPGLGVPAETSRRIACDASRVLMTHDPAGNPLHLGRKTRIISPALRRALTHRDPTCRFPGCTVTFCDAHHVRHWADGGETNLDNLVLLCRKHHRYVHEEGYRIQHRPGGQLRFLRPDGKPIPKAPPLPPLPNDPLAALAESLIQTGVDLGRLPRYPEWDGSRLDLAWALDALRSSDTAGPSG